MQYKKTDQNRQQQNAISLFTFIETSRKQHSPSSAFIRLLTPWDIKGKAEQATVIKLEFSLSCVKATLEVQLEFSQSCVKTTHSSVRIQSVLYEDTLRVKRSDHFRSECRDLRFKVDSERQIFKKLFHGRFIYSESFCQKSAERKSQKKYFFFVHISWTLCLISQFYHTQHLQRLHC